MPANFRQRTDESSRFMHSRLNYLTSLEPNIIIDAEWEARHWVRVCGTYKTTGPERNKTEIKLNRKSAQVEARTITIFQDKAKESDISVQNLKKNCQVSLVIFSVFHLVCCFVAGLNVGDRNTIRIHLIPLN